MHRVTRNLLWPPAVIHLCHTILNPPSSRNLSWGPKRQNCRVGRVGADLPMQTFTKISVQVFIQNPHISGKPVPGVEPGTGGFYSYNLSWYKIVVNCYCFRHCYDFTLYSDDPKMDTDAYPYLHFGSSQKKHAVMWSFQAVPGQNSGNNQTAYWTVSTTSLFFKPSFT